MDLPSKLETQQLVEGREELKQLIVELLSNQKGDFNQNYNLGSVGVISSQPSTVVVDRYVRGALKSIQGLKVLEIVPDMGTDPLIIDLKLEYNGEYEQFTISVGE